MTKLQQWRKQAMDRIEQAQGKIEAACAAKDAQALDAARTEFYDAMKARRILIESNRGVASI